MISASGIFPRSRSCSYLASGGHKFSNTSIDPKQKTPAIIGPSFAIRTLRWPVEPQLPANVISKARFARLSERGGNLLHKSDSSFKFIILIAGKIRTAAHRDARLVDCH